jgi:hypothetical protein
MTAPPSTAKVFQHHIAASANTGLLIELDWKGVFAVAGSAPAASVPKPRAYATSKLSITPTLSAGVQGLRHPLTDRRGRTVLVRNGGLLAQVRHHPTNPFFQV